MENNRCALNALCVHVCEVELCGQAEVKLAGGECVLCAYCGNNVNVKFGPVECSFSNFLGVLQAKSVENFPEGVLCGVPHFVVIVVLLLVCGVAQGKHAAVVGYVEVLVGVKDHVHNL